MIKPNNGIRFGRTSVDGSGDTGLFGGRWIVCLANIYRNDMHIHAVLSRCDRYGNIFEGGDVIEIGDRYVTASVPDVEGNSWSRADASVLIQVPGVGTDPKTGERIKFTSSEEQWDFSIGPVDLGVGAPVNIYETVVEGYILDKNGEKCMNDFSVSYEQQRIFHLSDGYSPTPLTNDKGEEVTEENYEEWANSFIEKVYRPFLKRVGL